MRIVIVIALCLWGSLDAAHAQESASFRLKERALNSGGQPVAGAAPASSGFQLTVGSIGDTVKPGVRLGPQYSLTGGLVGPLAPPAEVGNLRFVASDMLEWDPDGRAGNYALYEGSISDPFDPTFGACLLPTVPLPTASVPQIGLPGEARFYLVTARNRLGEEGPKGHSRTNPSPCP